MRGSRNFRQGWSRSICHIKSYDNVFLVLNLFYRRPTVTFIENYHFPRFQRGSNIFPGGGGGPTISRGGGGLIAYSL